MRGFTFPLCLLLGLTASSAAFGLDPNKAVTQYGLQVWGEQEGLPNSAVEAITQTQDGYLWLATEKGLARFDGVRFTVFDQSNTAALESDNILSLCAGRDGGLWIGTWGSGLVHYRDGEFNRYTVQNGLPNDVVWAVFEDHSGRLWIGTEAGLARLEAERVTRVWTAEKGSSPKVFAIAEAEDFLWFGSGSGLHRWKDGKVQTFTKKDGLLGDAVLRLHADSDGTLWIATPGGVARWKSGNFGNPIVVKEAPHVSACWKDRDGNLWVGTYGGGVLRIRGGQSEFFVKKQGLPSNLVRFLYEDREGSLWIGADGGGLVRLKDGSFTPYGIPEGMTEEIATSIREDRQGNLWIGTYGGGLHQLRHAKFMTYTSKDGLPNDQVMSLLEDRHGNLWIGCDFGGLSRFRNGRLERYEIGDGILRKRIRGLLEDRHGNLWIGTFGGGLIRVRDGEIRTYGVEQGLSDSRVAVLAEDHEGNLWIGTQGGGLNRLRDERFISFRTRDGLAGEAVSSIYEDGEGLLWIGTDHGLSLMKGGRLTSFGMKDGLLDNGILSILEDDQGNLWMSSNKGVFRVPKKDFFDFAQGKIRSLTCTSYTTADGMRSRECMFAVPAAWKTRDGNFWYPTVRGVVTVDPRRLRTNKIPPPIVIEEVVADGRALDPRRSARVAPGQGRLEIRYTGNSFFNPSKVRFRFKLEGFDGEWMDAGTRRMAYYSMLPPGRYIFRVIGANEDGVWNETGASFAFRLEPHFYQTILFKTLLASVAGLFLWALLRHRRHRVEAEFSAVLAERSRMARELHDTLMQGFAGISVQIEAARELLVSSPERADVHLERARALAQSNLAEARRSVLDLRSKFLEESDLPSALSNIMRELTQDLPVRTHFDVQGVPRPLPQSVEENLLRIGQEALTNSLQHADAREIRVGLRFEADSVTLRVADDGRGFDPGAGEIDRQGRLGIIGIRERAKQLEGHLDLKSAPGRGTDLSVTVPIR